MAIIDKIICEINTNILLAINNPDHSGIFGVAELKYYKDGYIPYIIDPNGSGKYIGLNNKHSISWCHIIDTMVNGNNELYESDESLKISVVMPVYYNTRFYKDRVYNIASQMSSALPKYIPHQQYNMKMIRIDYDSTNLNSEQILEVYYGMKPEQAKGIITDIGLFAITYSLELLLNNSCNPFCE